MDQQTKGLLRSKATWGVLAALAGTALGWGPDDQQAIGSGASDVVTHGLQLAGLGLALWGRISAKTRIRGVLGRS